MKVFIIGNVAGNNTVVEMKKEFIKAELHLKYLGYSVMSVRGILDCCPGFSEMDILHVAQSMVDVCDKVTILNNQQETSFILNLLSYAKEMRKEVLNG